MRWMSLFLGQTDQQRVIGEKLLLINRSFKISVNVCQSFDAICHSLTSPQQETLVD